MAGSLRPIVDPREAADIADKTFRLWVTVIRWIDGDTFTGVIDQGYYTYKGRETKPIRIRCAIIQAPEMKQAGGPTALLYASEMAPPGEFECISYKPDEYGRPLLDLILPDGDLFSARMLAAGQAIRYK